MPICWTQKLSLGDPEIDAQHQELFRRVNTFLAAAKEPQGAIAARSAVVREQMEAHFAAESRLMQRTAYPSAEEHAVEHELFTMLYEALSGRLAAEGPSGEVLFQLTRLLCEWFREHVTVTDRAMCEHARGAPAGGAGLA